MRVFENEERHRQINRLRTLAAKRIEESANTKRARNRGNSCSENCARIPGFLDEKLHRKRRAVAEAVKIARAVIITHVAREKPRQQSGMDVADVDNAALRDRERFFAYE